MRAFLHTLDQGKGRGTCVRLGRKAQAEQTKGAYEGTAGSQAGKWPVSG